MTRTRRECVGVLAFSRRSRSMRVTKSQRRSGRHETDTGLARPYMTSMRLRSYSEIAPRRSRTRRWKLKTIYGARAQRYRRHSRHYPPLDVTHVVFTWAFFGISVFLHLQNCLDIFGNVFLVFREKPNVRLYISILCICLILWQYMSRL